MLSIRKSLLSLLIFLFFFQSLVNYPVHGKDIIVDLTYPFDDSTIYWPTATSFSLKKVFEGITDKGYWYSSNEFCASEHGGTHMDAPVHFSKGKLTVDELPLEKCIGYGVVIDVSNKALKNPDYLVTVEDIKGWENKFGKIKEGSILLVHTGWGKFWPDKKKYLGSDKPKDTDNLHFPGFSKEAAEYIVNEKKVSIAGIDTPSLDYGQSKDFIAHQIFNGANIPGLENVANLDKLPPKGAKVYAIPMKIKGGTGAPTRVFAILP